MWWPDLAAGQFCNSPPRSLDVANPRSSSHHLSKRTTADDTHFTRLSELGGDGVAGQILVAYFAGLPLTWQAGGNSCVVEVAAEAGGHVGGGRGGLGEVPGALAAAPLDVGGIAGGSGVPGDEQGLDEEPERDGPLDGLAGAVAGVADAEDLLPGGVGGLDGPPPGVPFDGPGRGQGGVEGEDAQVVGFFRVGFAHQDQPAGCVLEAAVPQGRAGGDLGLLVAAVDVDGHVFPEQGAGGVPAFADPVSFDPGPPGNAFARISSIRAASW